MLEAYQEDGITPVGCLLSLEGGAIICIFLCHCKPEYGYLRGSGKLSEHLGLDHCGGSQLRPLVL